ncbi:MAG: hypothetical protein ACI9KS_000438 [Sulfitobacter sp.]|jgi:hypothetical protein
MELEPIWEYVADTVMGGVSRGAFAREIVDGRRAARLFGRVSLENNGGFIQMAFDLAGGGVFDARAYDGIELVVQGNGAGYELRLRTTALTRPWQSYRTAFRAPGPWTQLRFPFAQFQAHRTDVAFDPATLRRMGVIAVGREMDVDVSVASVSFYRGAV